MPDKTLSPTPASDKEDKTHLPVAAGGTSLPTPVAAGGIIPGGAPIGKLTSYLGLEADASDELAEVAPTFGDVLLSIGTGVADSQTALDAGLVTTVQQLRDTKIDVVTEVIQKLNDDGLPSVDQTTLVKNKLSLLNFVNPTVHEWKHVGISMDMLVGEMDYESGMTFKKEQHSGSSGGVGLFWGFLGLFGETSSESSQSGSSHQRQEADWSSGQVRLDAELHPRATTKFPVPADISVGPQIFFSQGSVNEVENAGVVTQRSMDIVIKVLKSSGAVNPSVPLQLDSDRFHFSFSNTAPFTGSTTNSQGEVKVTVSRDIPNAFFQRRVKGTITAQLGEIKKTLELSL
jgi:hypothetical protein